MAPFEKQRARRTVLRRLAAIAAAASIPARAQPAPPHIALLLNGTPVSHGHYAAAFHEGLKAAGYVEGRDLVVDSYWGEGDNAHLKSEIARLMSSRPRLVVTAGSPAVAALQRATTDIPIVFASAGDPVGQKFVASFARPGANITGIAYNDEVNQKIYEVAKAIVPAASGMAILVDRTNPAQEHHLRDVPKAERLLGFKAILVEANAQDALSGALREVAERRPGALIVPDLNLFGAHSKRIAAFALEHRIPSFSPIERYADEGGVATYNSPVSESFRRSADFVMRILHGTSPGDMPVEVPTRYALVLNLKTASALHLAVPPEMRLRAERLIE